MLTFACFHRLSTQEFPSFFQAAFSLLHFWTEQQSRRQQDERILFLSSVTPKGPTVYTFCILYHAGCSGKYIKKKSDIESLPSGSVSFTGKDKLYYGKEYYKKGHHVHGDQYQHHCQHITLAIKYIS